MRELMKLLDAKSATMLEWMLLQAGVRSELTTELNNPYTDAMATVVWVDDDAAPATLQDVTARFKEWSANPRMQQITYVDPTAEQETRCTGCNYDLRGQVDDGNCPECGRPYRILRQRRCPSCGTEGPVDFDVCWKCGADLAAV